MEPIRSFSEVSQNLKDGEIVCTVAHSNITYFFLKEGKIEVKSTGAHYHLTPKEFVSLFSKETFYLYNDSQPIVDESKDNAYYAWKSKSTN